MIKQSSATLKKSLLILIQYTLSGQQQIFRPDISVVGYLEEFPLSKSTFPMDGESKLLKMGNTLYTLGWW